MNYVGRRLLCVVILLLAIPLVFLAVFGSRPSNHLNDFHNSLLNACRDGNISEIERLLAAGSNPNTMDAYNNTPLSIAAHFGQTNAVRALLKAGVNVNGVSGEMTPFHCAAYSRHEEVAAFLLQNGADPNITDKHGTTPLAASANNGDAQLAGLLMDAGANVEQKDHHGWRALHIVLRSTKPSNTDRLATVAVLLKRGADPNAANAGGSANDSKHDSSPLYRRSLPNKGDTPVEIAKSNGFNEILAELKKYGGT